MQEINTSNLYDRDSHRGLANMWRALGFEKEKMDSMAEMELYSMNFDEFVARKDENN